MQLNIRKKNTAHNRKDDLRIKRKAEAKLLKARLRGRVFKSMPPSTRGRSNNTKMRGHDGTMDGPFRTSRVVVHGD